MAEHTSTDHTHVRFSFLRIMGLLLFALVIVVLSSVGTYFFILNELNQQIEVQPINRDRSKPTPSVSPSPSSASPSATVTPTPSPKEIVVTATPTITPTPTP